MKVVAARVLRVLLLRYARAEPRPEDLAGAERRVTILLSSAWGMGGTIFATLNLARQLARGYDVEIITAYRRRDKPFFGEFPSGLRVTPLEDQRASQPPGRLQRILRRRPSILIHSSDRLHRTFNLWTDLQLVRLLRRRTGILLTTRPALNILAAELQLPGMVTIGQEHSHLNDHRYIRFAMLRRYRDLNALLVLTPQDEREYRAALGDACRVYQVPNAVRRLHGPPADISAKVILTAGRLVYQKGYDLLISAYAAVAQSHPDWILRICGSGDQRPMLKELIAEHGLQDQVVLMGAVRDIGTEMSKASIFVMTSRSEGFPLVLLEAMSKAMAVVSFDCPTGPADLIDDHVNGLLVRHLDTDALADALGELMDDEGLRHRCAAAAAVTAAGYSADAIFPRWNTLLDETWERARGVRERRGPADELVPGEQLLT